jgi:mono/diheme cytochrome c family protein
MPGRPATLSLVVLALGLGGCNWYYDTLPSPDDLVKLVPWFDHMISSPAVHPYERADVPRRTVTGSVPVDAAEMDWSGPWAQAQYAVADPLMNPVDLTDDRLMAAGDTAYQVFCAVCHGTAGDGKGPVGPKVGAPSLQTDRARALSDGHLYSVIRYGRGIMPRYGDKIIDPEVRWGIVHYVRRLQAPGGTP